VRIEYGTVSVDGSGNIITKAGTLANDFTFSTQMAYGASGWSMYMFRNYSPRLGRWTQRDPIGLANLYTFCRNSPINLVDVLGLEAGDAAQRARALDIFSKALAAAGGLCLVIALCSNPLTATAMIFYGFAGGLGFSGLLIQLGVAIFGPHGGNRLNCPDQDEQDQEGEPEADGEGPQEGVEPPIADQLGFVPQPPKGGWTGHIG